MRNILVHNYFSIDTDIVWAVTENDLNRLKTVVKGHFEQLDNDEKP